jgi:hypothetical protein
VHDPDEAARKKAGNRVELLTPLVKAYNANLAYALTKDAMDVLGGAGYCRDYPIEQYARDVRVVGIYEGTQYIQALDLVGRKLAMEGGAVFMEFCGELMKFAGGLLEHPDFGADAKLLNQAAQHTADFAARFAGYFGDGRLSLIPMYATRFLDCLAETVLGQLLLEQGLVSREKLEQTKPDSADGIFYRGKIATAQFYCRNMLTKVMGRYLSLQQEDLSAMEVPEEVF